MTCKITRDETGRITKLEGNLLNELVIDVAYSGIYNPRFAAARSIAESRGRDSTDPKEIGAILYGMVIQKDPTESKILQSDDFFEDLFDNSIDNIFTENEELLSIFTSEVATINRSLNTVDETLADPDITKERRSKVLKRKIELEARKRRAQERLKKRNAGDFQKLSKIRDFFLGHNYDYASNQYGGHLYNIKQLLRKPELTNQEIAEVLPLLIRLSTVNQLDDIESHLFIRPDQDIKGNQGVSKLVAEISRISNDLLQKLVEHQYNNLQNVAIQYQGEKMTDKEMKGAYDDIGLATANLRGLDMIDDRYSSLIVDIMGKVIYDYNEEIRRENAKVTDLVKAAEPFLTEDMLVQKYKDGKRTGRIMHHYTPEFQERAEALQNVQMYGDYSDGIKDTVDKYKKFIKEETLWINASDLYELIVAKNEDLSKVNKYNKKVQANIREMKQFFPEEELKEAFDSMQAQLENLYGNIKALKEEFESKYKREFKDVDENDPIVKDLVLQYRENVDSLIENSPLGFAYFITDRRKLSNKKRKYKGRQSARFYIPKKKEYYDAKFHAIKNQKEVYDLWKYIIKQSRSVQKYASTAEKKMMSDNFIPFVASNTMDTMLKFGAVAKKTVDSFRDALVKLDTAESAVDDKATGKLKKSVRRVTLTMSPTVIEREIRSIMLEEEKLPENKGRSKEAIRREVIDEHAKQQSWDLEALLQLQNYNHISYKHKLRAQDSVELVKALSDNRRGFVQSKFGNRLRKLKNLKDMDWMGKLNYLSSDKDFVTSENPPNLKDTQEHYLDVTFYGINTERHFGKLHEWSTEDAKKAQEFLEEYGFTDSMPNEEIANLLSAHKTVGNLTEFTIDDIYDSMRVARYKEVVTASSILDGVQKYTQLKGMAYNIFSGIATILYGHIANTVESGRWYSEDNLMKARDILFKGYTSKLTGEKDSEFRKADTILERFDLLTDSRQEMENAIKPDTDKLGEKMGLFAIEKFSEKKVQDPIAVAMFMDATVEIEGKGKVSVWDALDKDLNWNTEEYGPEPEGVMAKLVSDTRKVIARVHGNYNRYSPIMAKKSAIGKLALQFRTWAIEGYANRFEKESHKGEIKGRYRSYIPMVRAMSSSEEEANKVSLMGTGKMIIFLLRETGIRIMANFTRSKSLRNRDHKFKKLMGKGLSDVDAKNMYSNIKELAFFAQLYVVSVILTAAMDQMGDDDETAHSAVTFMLNMLTRLETDISLYANPNEFQKLNKSFIPAMGVLQDAQDIVDAAIKTLSGNVYVETGINAGDPWLIKETFTALPGFTQLYRARSATSKLFE